MTNEQIASEIREAIASNKESKIKVDEALCHALNVINAQIKKECTKTDKEPDKEKIEGLSSEAIDLINRTKIAAADNAWSLAKEIDKYPWESEFEFAACFSLNQVCKSFATLKSEVYKLPYEEALRRFNRHKSYKEFLERENIKKPNMEATHSNTENMKRDLTEAEKEMLRAISLILSW